VVADGAASERDCQTLADGGLSLLEVTVPPIELSRTPNQALKTVCP
jgi:hypothetical protein